MPQSPKSYFEFGFVPKCTVEHRQHFALDFVRTYERDSRDAFTIHSEGDALTSSWNRLKKAGWRIVRVKVVEA